MLILKFSHLSSLSHNKPVIRRGRCLGSWNRQCVAGVYYDIVFSEKTESESVMTTGNYKASSSFEPVLPAVAAVNANNDDIKDDTQVTSAADDDSSRPATTQRKTRKKRPSSGGKSDGIGDVVTTQQQEQGSSRFLSTLYAQNEKYKC